MSIEQWILNLIPVDLGHKLKLSDSRTDKKKTVNQNFKKLLIYPYKKNNNFS